MVFDYKAIDKGGAVREGTVDAANLDVAISAVENRGYTVVSVQPAEQRLSFGNMEINLFARIKNKEIVILSRQIATLFEAKVSPLRIFRLLAAENSNKTLQNVLYDIVEDLQAGSSLSRAFSSHPDVFSPFYINMVKAGEEAGTLERSFTYLADYLDRSYQLVSKAKNALVYPAFVIGIFIIVMVLMLTTVIPNIAAILIDSGQELPIYTRIVIGLSDFLVAFYPFIVAAFAAGVVALWRFSRTSAGRRVIDEFVLSIPVLGDLQQKLLLTRICDNMSTMIASGVAMVQAIEVTAEVVDNAVYKDIIERALVDVKGGRSFADSISEYKEIPGVLAQMAKVGEETGNLPEILDTLATFYRREVNNAVDTMIGLIEPIMIVMLGLGVGTLLASVLMPIYNLTSAF